MNSNTIRWGVLSTARIAGALVNAFSLAGRSELRAVASRDAARAQEWAREQGVPVTFDSYDALLASDEIDAVYIPLPNALHKEWSVRAARQRKHVLCEKPIAANVDEVRQIATAATEHGVTVMEGFMYRFHPQITELRRLLASNAIGQVKTIRATFGFRLTRPNDVRWSDELAGGALMDVGSYCVNVIRLVAGAEPVAVTATANWAPTGVDQALVGTMEFADNTLATMDCSFLTGPTGQQGLSISGTDGRITMPAPFRADLAPATITIETVDGTETLEPPDADPYHMMVEHFERALLDGEPLDYPIGSSLRNTQVMDALREAARTGRRVEL